MSQQNTPTDTRPADAQAYMKRGSAKAEQNDWDGAIADYDEAIKLSPDSAEAYYSRGHAKAEKDDWNEAFKDLNEALRLAKQEKWRGHTPTIRQSSVQIPPKGGASG